MKNGLRLGLHAGPQVLSCFPILSPPGQRLVAPSIVILPYSGVCVRPEREQVPADLRPGGGVQEDQETDAGRFQPQTARHCLRRHQVSFSIKFFHVGIYLISVIVIT